MKTKSFITIVITAILIACTKTNPNLVTITGKITNPIGKPVAFTGKDTSFTTKIIEDGIFEIKFSLDSSTYLNFEHGVEQTAMYVVPGDKINLTIDTKQFDESIKYEESPASSFLAYKYLLEEKGDFFGKVFYLSNSEEYRAVMDEFKSSLTNKLDLINDSSFVKSEIANIDNSIAYYISNQEEILEYEIDVRTYMGEKRELGKKYEFYSAIDSLSSNEFNDLLNDYSENANALLNTVKDKEYIISAKKSIEHNINWWKERKELTDKMPKEGEEAIDFTYPDKNGNEFSLSSFKGSLVYVDVWATWCGPCIGEIPALQKLEKEYHDKNITFLSISIDKKKDEWLKMVEDKNLGGIQLWAGDLWSDGMIGITKDYAIFGIPRFMLFSAEGKVISTDALRPSYPGIRDLLNSNL